MTILIVDDEPSVLRYIAAVVRKEGYEVLQADGGEEALAVCKSHDYYIDLMISDVAMPRMNGRALAECMNERYPGVPIIFVSGYPASRELVKGLKARGFENGYIYLQKPCKPEELLRSIATALAAGAKLKTSTAST